MNPKATAEKYLENVKQMKEIAQKVKALQISLGLDKIKAQNKELKELLYNHMDVNNLEEFETIKITTVMPSDVKKEIKIESKKDNIAEIITGKIDENEFDDIVEKLAVL